MKHAGDRAGGIAAAGQSVFGALRQKAAWPREQFSLPYNPGDLRTAQMRTRTKGGSRMRRPLLPYYAKELLGVLDSGALRLN